MRGYATVTDISRRSDTAYIVAVEIGNGYGSERMEFNLLPEDFEEANIGLGEIDEDDILLLESCDAVTRAFIAACESLAFSLCSHKALFRKLISKKHSRDAAERAVEIVRERGYIDENSLALRRAELMVEKLWGRSRILAKLRDEELDDFAISSVREYLLEIDFAENCARVIEKKFSVLPYERKEREKMFASLSRLGFSSSDIREAVKNINKSQ